MADTPITWRNCIIRPESWNGRSRFQHLPRKISGRSRCRERIGRLADTLWLCAALLPQGKARKLVGPHLNCKFRSDLKRKEQQHGDNVETTCGAGPRPGTLSCVSCRGPHT